MYVERQHDVILSFVLGPLSCKQDLSQPGRADLLADFFISCLNFYC